ncbi:hypothetical protein D3C84_1015320 [compost metagenome]
MEHSRSYVDKMNRLGKGHLIYVYDELPGVGERSHLTGISAEQSQMIAEHSERSRQVHRSTPQLPDSGVLLIGGYLIAKPFQIHLETVNGLAYMQYDLTNRKHRLFASEPYRYRIVWRDGQIEEGCCDSISEYNT